MHKDIDIDHIDKYALEFYSAIRKNEMELRH